MEPSLVLVCGCANPLATEAFFGQARAEALLKQMESKGIARDVVTYNILLDLHRYDATRIEELLAQAPPYRTSREKSDWVEARLDRLRARMWVMTAR